jgi:hypothetical protein
VAFPGGRRLEHEGRTYEWVVRRRGNEFRMVVQDAAARGQLLVARFPVYVLCLLNEPHGEYYVRTRFTPWRLRSAVAGGLGKGWRPTAKGLPPLLLGYGGAWGLDDDPAFYRCIDGLWSVLDAICRDPAWRARLAKNGAAPVPRDYVRGLGAELEERVGPAGELAVHVRALDHGDTEPHLAIRGLTWGKDLVLEDISDWYGGL